MEPEDWLSRPVIIELESLGEGPANFMSLLISTLIREVLKIRKISDVKKDNNNGFKREIEHVIFYEEAHNLIGPTTDDPVGGSVDPKISATKYLVKMLAEVRALGEGIVIADQLPTAMAPEVLKNTGLKLGHRITAQDDRNLLGGTMSASADQLEEQGTFGTGQALIFYENLLKPFKMRVCEWEKGMPSTKYDSPTNLQLFERLKDNETYNTLLVRSASIMQEKMEAEFDVYRRKAETLKKAISKKYAEISVISGNISVLERKLSRLTDIEEIEETKKHTEFEGVITRDLKKLCWSFANLYFAYMTLSKNYSIHSDDMYMCTINNYLSLFGILKSLHGDMGLSKIVINETASVMNDVCRYIDVHFENADVLLAGHPAYDNAIYETGNYQVNLFDAETLSAEKEAVDLVSRESASEIEFTNFGKDFSDIYFKLLTIAEKYYEIADALSRNIQVALHNDFQRDTAEWALANARAVEYESHKMSLYKALVAYVVKIFKTVSGISGANRRAFLIQTSKMLGSFRTVVDYRDKNAKTKLSDWSKYSDVWKGTNEILGMEMSAKFAYLHQVRLESIDRANGNSLDAYCLTNICIQYNTVFQIYSRVRVESFEYKCALLNHYIKYLESILKLGAYTHTVIAETSNGNWRMCSNLIKELMQDERVNESKKADWNRLSVIMKAICESAD